MTAGIYTITNASTGKVYVGSSSNIEARWRQHMSDLRLQKHGNGKLQNAWKKYGPAAFVFSIVERVEVESDLLTRERYFIDSLNAVIDGYNICLIPGRSRAGMKHRPESIERMSLAKKGKAVTPEQRKRLSDAFKGRQFTDEWRRKISEAKTGVRRRPFSEEVRANMSAGQRGRVHTQETRAKLSAAHTGKVMSANARARMSESQRGRVMSPEAIAKREATKRAKRLRLQEVNG